jgi:hypothetical protein
MYSPVFLLTSVLVTIGGAQNIRIASDGLIAATQRSGGLFVQRGDDVPIEIPLPQGYAGFADIALSEDDRLLFALSTSSARGVCSFLRSGDTFTLVGCETRENLSVSPFAGIDAREGVCVVSGGVGGMTVYEYDIVTGILDSSPRFLNQDVENTFGFPDVQLLGRNLAAMSTDFADSGSTGNPRFGTMMVNLNTGLESHNFRVADSLGFQSNVGPANFPIVNSFYSDSATGVVYMYTANGGITVQEALQPGTTQVIAAPSFSNGLFRAVTVAVDQTNDLLALGGLVGSSQSIVLFYDISLAPLSPTFVSSEIVTGRITSIGANGGVVAYVANNVGGIEVLTARATVTPTVAPTIATALPTSTPTMSMGPSASPRPSAQPSESQEPSISPAPSASPTETVATTSPIADSKAGRIGFDDFISVFLVVLLPCLAVLMF